MWFPGQKRNEPQICCHFMNIRTLSNFVAYFTALSVCKMCSVEWWDGRGIWNGNYKEENGFLSFIVNYNTFRLAVYPTCFDIYNIICRGICFYVTNQTLAQGYCLWLYLVFNIQISLKMAL
jgi:hypothetical protein